MTIARPTTAALLLAVAIAGCGGGDDVVTGERIPASWTSATDGAPRVAVGPWFGWSLSVSGGLVDAAASETEPPPASLPVCGVYVAWIDAPDENPHASPDREDRSLDGQTLYAVGYVNVLDRTGPLVLELQRATPGLLAGPTRRGGERRPAGPVQLVEGLTLELNIVAEDGRYAHTATTFPARQRELRADPPFGDGSEAANASDNGPRRVDWVVPDVARPVRTRQWKTLQPVDLASLTLELPDPYAPNDPTRIIVIHTRPR